MCPNSITFLVLKVDNEYRAKYVAPWLNTGYGTQEPGTAQQRENFAKSLGLERRKSRQAGLPLIATSMVSAASLPVSIAVVCCTAWCMALQLLNCVHAGSSRRNSISLYDARALVDIPEGCVQGVNLSQ